MRRVLLVTTASDLAADLVVLQLGRRGVPFVRFNQEDFPEHVTMAWPGDGRCGALAVGGEVVPCAEIHSAWFRYSAAPSVQAGEERRTADFILRESAGFLAGFWETAPWFWMNRPSAAALAGNKLRQLAQARALGFLVPETLVTNCPRRARDFIGGHGGIAKAVVNGGLVEAGRRYAVYTTPVTGDDLTDEAVCAAPAIFQERIANDFDLRVTVVGTRVFGTRISVRNRDGDRETDWRAIDPARLAYEKQRLPSSLEAACVTLVKAFSLSFAALDFIVTPTGEHVFLELNPSGQWGWLEEATGLPLTDAIVEQLVEGTP
jgi:MvdD-like protein with pre-ATP grasp domain